ncbi:MAG: arginine--tRNA ligase [Ruminococcaceae bacterium]|nr:arginine--tRNA ligase [Oscillospiraceae bacterium]
MNKSTNDIVAKIKAQVIDTVEAALKAANIEAELPEIEVEVPADKAHGDFSTNTAMKLTRLLKQPPRAIAQTLLDSFDFSGTYIERAEIAGPGFINFFLNPAWRYDGLRAIGEMGNQFGKTEFGKGKKVMVEFVSANPTGPMHMGNARGGALGDSLACAMQWAGFDVTKEFYVNDAGAQIEKFGISLEARYIQLIKGEDAIEFPEDGYQGDDIREHAKNFIEIHGDKYIDADVETRRKALVDYALELNIAALERDLAKYRIIYDVWFRESTIHANGEVAETIEALRKSGLTYEADGALWLKTTEFGCEKDEVLIRANGFPTYFAVDIAYHRNKFEKRGFDQVINVWGADHHGHVARMKGAMDAIGVDSSKLDVAIIQLVRLMRNGEVARMSKRTGKMITMSDLIDEIGVDAARFFFNFRQAGSHLDFDLDLAVAQNSENPVFYVQYAHARICSILRNLAAEGISCKPIAEVDLSLLTAPEEEALIEKLVSLPQEIIAVAQTMEPSKLTRYVLELAGMFHAFYTACRVKCDDDALMQARLTLCNATRTVISNVLEILRIDAPEKM